ncbi:MAG TPA: hypothetical protein PKM57_09360 [Kiritimatiellia bacterium]|nr:hypothetical protein [Kiritimatiellia bacterium]HPS08301.1 hypothetical protein [Kiritimatiellia bacterium]
MQTRLIMMAGLFLAVNLAFGTEGDARFYGGGGDGCDGMSTRARSLDGGPQVSFWSASAQTFVWTDADDSLATLSIAVWDPQSAVTNGGTFRISVPSAWLCRFGTNATVVVGGAAAAKIGSPYYTADGRSLVLPITADFEVGDLVTVTGLRVVDLHLCHSGSQWLELSFTDVDACDEYPLQMRVLWYGGSYDDWGIATSEPLGFYVPSGTIIGVH